MRGCIKFRHVLMHVPTVVRGFGWRTLWACVMSEIRNEHRTFLEIQKSATLSAERSTR